MYRGEEQLHFCKKSINWTEYTDIFIIFIFNPKWLYLTWSAEIKELRYEDRRDIYRRVFKIKFDDFIKDLSKNKVHRRIKIGVIYVNDIIINAYYQNLF